MTLYDIIKPIVEAYEMGLSIETSVLVEAVNQLTAKLPARAIEQLDACPLGRLQKLRFCPVSEGYTPIRTAG